MMVNYGYDNRNQVTSQSYQTLAGAVHSLAAEANQSLEFDPNGNRLSSLGDRLSDDEEDNRIADDGTYSYLYDKEGNITRRTNNGTGSYRKFEWDYRNRLVAVLDYNAAGTLLQRVGHTYDAFNRWIGQTIDKNGDGTVDSTKQYVQDGGQVALAFTDGQLTNRYFWSTAVDELLADEAIAHGQIFGETRWTLTDHLGSVRDLVDTDSLVVDHAVYDAYGNVLGSSADSPIDSLFGFTGRAYDEATDLQNNHHRWYDAESGRWISQDPIGFDADDTNLYRYVGNWPLNKTDPSGLYGVQGHFWTVYVVARAAGKGKTEAYNLAYYAQLPDQLSRFDAMDNFNSTPYANGLYDCIHSLHGGDAAAIAQRRAFLASYLKTNYSKINAWQKGMVLHALGDAYAHTEGQGDEERAFGQTGHWKKAPDVIGTDWRKYAKYVHTLYATLGGQGDSNIIGDLLSTTFTFRSDPDYDTECENIPGIAKRIVGVDYDFPFHPNDDHNIDNAMYSPSKTELVAFMNHLKQKMKQFESQGHTR